MQRSIQVSSLQSLTRRTSLQLSVKSGFIFSVLFRELQDGAAISLRFIAIFVDWQPRHLGLPKLRLGLPNLTSKVAKTGRGVAKSAPFRVNLATWLATLEAAVKSSESVGWYLTNFLSLNCPESAKRNATPPVATMPDNGLAMAGLLYSEFRDAKKLLPYVMHILDSADARH